MSNKKCEYFWGEGARYKASPQVVGELFDRLARKHDLPDIKSLTPQQVLEEAANPSSPIHDDYTWDDAAAARIHRENQARGMIRSIRFEIIIKEKIERVRTYVNVRSPGKKSVYVRSTDAAQSPEYNGYVIGAAKRGLLEWAARHKQLCALGNVQLILDEFIDEVNRTMADPDEARRSAPEHRLAANAVRTLQKWRTDSEVLEQKTKDRDITGGLKLVDLAIQKLKSASDRMAPGTRAKGA
jgi:hypothetical protein